MFKKITQRTLVLLSAGFAVVIVLGGAVSLVAYRVYVVRDGSALIRSVAAGLPAARVGSRTITYGRFEDVRDTLRTYMSSDAAKQEGSPQVLTPELEKNTIERLMREAAIQEYAESKSLTTTDDEVAAAYMQIAASTSSTIPDIASYMKTNFGWTEDDFRREVVRPALLEQHAASTFASTTQEAYDKLETYLADRLKKPDVKMYLRF